MVENLTSSGYILNHIDTLKGLRYDLIQQVKF